MLNHKFGLQVWQSS